MVNQNKYAVLVFTSLLGLLFGCKPDTNQTPLEFRVPVETAVIESANVEYSITTIGKLRVQELYTLSAKTKGTLIISKANTQLLGEGDRVEKDQLIATISGEEARLALRKEEVEQKLETATKNLEAAKKLYEKSLIPTRQFGQIKDNFAEAKLEQQISQNKAKQNIITSPIDGYILSLARDEDGQKMASGQSVNDGQVIAKVAATNKLVLDVHILPVDLKRIQIGMPAKVYASAWKGKEFEANLVRISAHIDEQTNTLRAELVVNNEQHLLKPGMFVEAALIVEEKQNVVVLPSDAIANRGGRNVVFVSSGQRVEQRTVTLGIKNGSVVEVLNGVALGESVVTAGINTLTDNMPIQIVKSAGI